jgi:hypothetical protein
MKIAAAMGGEGFPLLPIYGFIFTGRPMVYE